MRTLSMIIEFASLVLIPLGAGLFLRTYVVEGTPLMDALLSTVAAMVGMIPQGLVLLTSGVLAIATTRLGMHSVLVQQSYCVETLARVDMLCLDKTGTITSGQMEVTKVLGVGETPREEVERSFCTVTHANQNDANETALALMSYAEGAGATPEPISRAIPFSSARKYSGCVTERGRAFVLGAAQFVLGPAAEEWREYVSSFGERERVLTIAEVDGFEHTGALVGTPRVLGFVGLRDEIRPTAADTIKYFRNQGVNLKVISGDNPLTVSRIAEKCGIVNSDKYISLAGVPLEDIPNIAEEYTIFGRVSPEQKEALVAALQANSHKVAMTGDGVNDILALRRSDSSITFAKATDAAKSCSDVVLLDNDFSHLKVVDENTIAPEEYVVMIGVQTPKSFTVHWMNGTTELGSSTVKASSCMMFPSRSSTQPVRST